MTVLRELFVLLGLETDSGEFKRAEKAIDQVKSAAAALTAAIGTTAAALGIMGRQSLQAADDLGKWQNRVGGTIEELGALKIAAEASGLTGQQAFEGIVEVGERASDVVRNVKTLTGDAGESFKALGFTSVRQLQKPNGQLREGIDLFDDVLKRLAKVQVATDRTGIAMRLFGDDVGQALTAANLQTFEQMRAEAQQLGLVLSEENVRAARAFNRESSLLGSTLGALRDQLTFGLLPEVMEVTKQIRGWITTNRKLIGSKIDKFTERLTKTFRQGVANLRAYAGFLRRVWREMETFRYAVLGLAGAFALVKIGATVSAIAGALASLYTGLVAAGAAGLLVSLKMAALGAAFIAVGLILEDAIVHIQGGKSAIGELLQVLRQPINEDDFALLKIAKAAIRIFDGLVKSAADVVNLFEGGAVAEAAKLALRDRGIQLIGRLQGKSPDQIQQEISDLRALEGLGQRLQDRQQADLLNARLSAERNRAAYYAGAGRGAPTINAPITLSISGTATPEAAADARQIVGGAIVGAVEDAGREIGE